MTPQRIAIVDDHESFRRAAVAIAAAAGLDVAGEASDANAARQLLRAIDRPDLVLIDVNLGDGSGLELTVELLTEDPDLRIVLVSTMGAIDLPEAAADTGASCFVEKSKLGPEVLRFLTTAPLCWGCSLPLEDSHQRPRNGEAADRSSTS